MSRFLISGWLLLTAVSCFPEGATKTKNVGSSGKDMSQILDYIEAKRVEYERSGAYLQLLRSEEFTVEEKLAGSLMWVPFIFGYSDMNQHMFRDQTNNENPVQQELNVHTFEEDFHWQWMLDDFSKIGTDLTSPVSDLSRLLWSPAMYAPRRVILELQSLWMQNRDPILVLSMVETIEATSVTAFKQCQGFKNSQGVEIEFWGTKHYLLEAGHLIKDPNNPIREFPITDEQLEKGLQVVDSVFNTFTNFGNELVDFTMEIVKLARENNGDNSLYYQQLIEDSKQKPRYPVYPDWLSEQVSTASKPVSKQLSDTSEPCLLSQ